MGDRKRRIDLLLVERGYAESRHKAQALLLAGQVLVNEQKTEKSGQRVDPDAAIRILGETPYVSRGGGKLEAALAHFQIQAAGRVCADLGAATGGFTDCLLQHGAAAVHAYDVGSGQLAWKLSQDPRVILHDHCNVRYLGPADLPEGISLVTADLSFISLSKVLEPLAQALGAKLSSSTQDRRPEPVDLVLLVKPQFEVGKGEVGKGGIVRDPEKQRLALAAVEQEAVSAGFRILGSMPSPVLGAGGNQEFLLHLRLLPDL